MKSLKNVLLVTIVNLMAGALWADAAVEAWVQRYSHDVGSDDRARKVVTDSAGDVIVAGSSDDGNTGGALLIKYTSGGVALWTNRNNGIAQVAGVAADGNGNVYVAGSLDGYVTVAYTSSGVPVWTNRYSPGLVIDSASAIAVGLDGTVYVTGTSSAYIPALDRITEDYATVAYTSAGLALWTNRYNGPGNLGDWATAIAVGGNGNIYVTGSSLGSPPDYPVDYTTVAYNSAGALLWVRRYSVGTSDEATAIAVGENGNVYVTGSSRNSDNTVDYATVAYSTVGAQLWTRRYNGLGNDYFLCAGDCGGRKRQRVCHRVFGWPREY